MKIRATETGNQALGEALLAEGAVLGPGAVPDANTGSEEGKKALVEAIQGAAAAVIKEKPAKGKNKEKAEKSEPKTTLEWGNPEFKIQNESL